jgi:hypothetical protein
MHDVSKLAPDDLPAARAECQMLMSFRAERRELEDTAKVTRIREHMAAHAAAVLPDSARVLSECCCCALARCVKLFGQINDEIHTLENGMNEAERRAGERHDEMVRRVDHLTDLVISLMGA